MGHMPRFIAPLDRFLQLMCYVFACYGTTVIVSMLISVHIGCLCVDPQKPTQRPLCTKSDEVRLAEEASKKYGNPAPTIFSKVVDKSIPADIIYEDEKVLLEPRDSATYSSIQSIHSTSLFHILLCYSLIPNLDTLSDNRQSDLE